MRTTNFRRKTALAVLFVCVSLGLWANGAAESSAGSEYYFSRTQIADQGFGTMQIPTNAAIKAFFAEHGIDSAYLDRPLSEIPHAVREDIDAVMEDDDAASALDGLVKEELGKYLKEDETEYVYMTVARHRWSMQLDTNGSGPVL